MGADARCVGNRRRSACSFVWLGLLGFACGSGCASPVTPPDSMTTVDFEFVSSGRQLSGLIDQPATREARAVIVFVHGTGLTNVREENRYADLRRRFADIGIASVIWDKPGLGRSEGAYDDNQPLEESAQEVLDAVAALRARKIPGSNLIGVWSTSRGSWVAPIAMSQNPGITFWISVGGVPAEDNKYYLMNSNLPLEGRTVAETARLMEEWKRGRQIFFQGGSYDAYLAATENLRTDPAVFYFAGNLTGTREAYEAEQRAYLETQDDVELDERTWSVVRVRRFDRMLNALPIDVLALFGENDTNVDWRRARALYESTIGRNPDATLRVRTFPGCNHIINPSATGSVREVEASPAGGGTKCPGYYDAQLDWLRTFALGG